MKLGPRLVARLRETLAVFGNTPRIARLVWRAGPAYTTGQLLISTIQGFQSLIEGWLAKVIVDAIAAAVMGAGDPLAALPALAGILVFRGAEAMLMACLWAPNRFVWQQLGDLLTRDVNHLILAKANAFKDIRLFESPAFYDTLLKAQSEAPYRPVSMMNNLHSTVRDGLRLLTMLGVLVAFSPVVAVALVALSVPNVYALFRQADQMWALNSGMVPEVRKMSYLRRLLTDKNEAKEIRLFGLGDHFLGEHARTFAAFHARYTAMRRRHWRSNSALAVLAALGSAGALAYGVLAALRGTLSLGDLLFYTAAISQVQQSLSGMTWQVAGFYQGNLFIRNLFAFLDLPESMPEPPAGTKPAAPSPMHRGIELQGVAFRYDPDAPDVLQDVSLAIRPGQTVALVGENGAGKATLVKLLGRLYDPTEGAIFVDGIDLRDVDLEEWRERIGAIFQDFCRYHLAAKTNIGLGSLRKLENMAAIERAAGSGGATAVIEKLEDGYDTVLGRWLGTSRGEVQREGAELSGGEWQKVALSRGFMRSDGNGSVADPAQEADSVSNGDAQLLILDEPTASLDTQSEYDVYLRFRELTRGKATLLISHRFSTVRMADRIVVLEHGKIMEDGTHAELIALNGTYADLYEKQASRYR